MAREPVLARIAALGRANFGVFTAREALGRGVTRDQLTRLVRDGIIERVLPGTYRVAGVAPSMESRLAAALAWAGQDAVATGRSAAWLYGFEGVRPSRPEIGVMPTNRCRHSSIAVRRYEDRAALMVREHRGFRVAGVEATLVALAHALDGEAFEIACEDARRRRLTSVTALRAYLDRFGRQGRPGIRATRALLAELDPVHPARSTLEVKTRRLLVAHRITDFVREFPLAWNGRTYFFDFAFPAQRTILETNGRRWHDDPVDFEHDHEKWSVPGRHGYRLVLATWDKVTRAPHALLDDLATTLVAA